MSKKTQKNKFLHGDKTTPAPRAVSTSKVGATCEVESECQSCPMSAMLIPLAVAAVTLGLFLYLPVPVTLFSNPQDDNLTALGEILSKNPLVQCTEDIANFTPYRRVKIDILLANFNRVNTSRYGLQVFVAEAGIKTVLANEIFQAETVEDNKYRSFEIEVPPTTPGKLCIALSTTDAAPGNGITVWLNGKRNPVMEITATATPALMLAGLAELNHFGLGRGALLGLFFIYLLVQVWLIFYLYAKAKTANHPHHRRTGKS